MGRLDGKIAVVTGAGRGIGREIALDLAREGAFVVVNDLGGDLNGSRSSKVADEVVAEIGAAGGSAVACYDSVATVEGGRKIFQTALDRFDGLDILVNNAGNLRDRTLYKMEEEDWDEVIAVHLKGHFCCTQPFARYIRDTNRQNCRIVNVSSESGLVGSFGQSNYAAAKAGVVGFSWAMALELEKYQATVNVLSPGAQTRMVVPLMEEGTANPSDPTLGPQLVAPVVTWLASDAAQAVTGQIIEIKEGAILGIRSRPEMVRSFKSDTLYTQDQLDQLMPALVEAERAHEKKLQSGVEPEPV